MKLRQLRYVQAVADTQSFSRAAEICHATQPTLSNAIAVLEEELGGKLFVRTTRMVELTPFGAYLLPYLKAVLDARDEVGKAAQAWHNPVHKLLRIGFSPLVDPKLLNRVLAPFRQRHPNISVFFKECLLDDLDQRLAAETIDIAIVPRRDYDESSTHTPFYSDALLYLPSDAGNAQNLSGPLSLARVPDTPIIMTGGGCGLNGMLKALFEQQGVSLRAYPGQAISYQAIEEWTDLGIGAAILPAAKLSVQGRSNAISLHLNNGRTANVEFDWIWNPAHQGQAPIEELIDYIKSTVPALVNGSIDEHDTESRSNEGMRRS